MAKLARIRIYPVKSFDPLEVQRARLLPIGALEHDRRFALRDRQGEFVNGKRTDAVHRLRSSFDPRLGRLTLRVDGTDETLAFDVNSERQKLSQWLSDYFDTVLEIVENPAGGFPDDTESPGPTLISTATLGEVASWFPGLSVEDVRLRFRANLEIDGVEPFWEDRLVADEGHVVRFQLGAAELWGTNPCQRCIVPIRSPWSGEVMHGFSRAFAARRRESLPAFAPASRFDHFYRLAVNTRSAGSEPVEVAVGDELRVLGIA